MTDSCLPSITRFKPPVIKFLKFASCFVTMFLKSHCSLSSLSYEESGLMDNVFEPYLRATEPTSHKIYNKLTKYS